MSRLAYLLILTLLAGLSACDEDISSASRLRRPRLLAIQAEPPNPAFGQTTLLRPLVYVTPGEPLTYEWSWCPVPTRSDDGYRCPVDQAAADGIAALTGLAGIPPLFLGTAETIAFTNPFPPALLASLCAGDSAVTSLFFAGRSGATDDENPQVYTCAIATLPVQVMLTIRGSVTDTGVVSLRLPIDEATPGNVNPIATGLRVLSPAPERLLDQTALVSVPRDAKVELHADIAPTQAEVYIDRQLDANDDYVRDDAGQFVLGPTTERLSLSWFSEGGGFAERHSGWGARDLDGNGQPVPFSSGIENEWTTPKIEDYTPATSLVLVVVRDSRGGVGWAQGIATLESTP